MYRNLSVTEEKWIKRLLDVNFQGRDILFNQFLKAKVSCDEEYSFISMKFKIEGKIETYPYHVRVPVEMRAFQQSKAPIIFLLHVINGVIDELEIFTADLEKINSNHIELEKVEYDINQAVRMEN